MAAKPNARTLMVQGTSSSVGKSLLVAALCRIYARRGVKVAPFKAQNMSNNAAVCADGSEIGRSQATQAAACRIEPDAVMNPILLKPEADSRSQVIVSGRPWRTIDARHYFRVREQLWPVVTSSLDQLRREYDLVVIEGAGSPAELNLATFDIVNMTVARYCESPVLLVGDIDRGGVFAQLLGTLMLLDDSDRDRVHGLIVNKFRGDRSLFDAGVQILEQRAGIPVLGVIPWLHNLNIPEEDGHSLETGVRDPAANEPLPRSMIDIAVIRLPRISNFDDFDPLASQSGVRLRYVDSCEQLGHPNAIILPGTKSTVADMHWLRMSGLADRMTELGRHGTSIVGICGGYQMLGQAILDPQHVESSATETVGLGFFDFKTTFTATKLTHIVRAEINDDRHCRGTLGQPITGYEIHMGQTPGTMGWLRIIERGGNEVAVPDGAVSADGRIWGCYVHGLFANDSIRHAWLEGLKHSRNDGRPEGAGMQKECDVATPEKRLDSQLDQLADHYEAALDMRRIDRIVGMSKELQHV